jgi:hypothetical protein
LLRPVWLRFGKSPGIFIWVLITLACKPIGPGQALSPADQSWHIKAACFASTHVYTRPSDLRTCVPEPPLPRCPFLLFLLWRCLITYGFFIKGGNFKFHSRICQQTPWQRGYAHILAAKEAGDIFSCSNRCSKFTARSICMHALHVQTVNYHLSSEMKSAHRLKLLAPAIWEVNFLSKAFKNFLFSWSKLVSREPLRKDVFDMSVCGEHHAGKYGFFCFVFFFWLLFFPPKAAEHAWLPRSRPGLSSGRAQVYVSSQCHCSKHTYIGMPYVCCLLTSQVWFRNEFSWPCSEFSHCHLSKHGACTGRTRFSHIDPRDGTASHIDPKIVPIGDVFGIGMGFRRD